MLTSVYLIGWFLSVYWAYKFVMSATKPAAKLGGPSGIQNGGNYNPYG